MTGLWIAAIAALLFPVAGLLAGVLRWPRDFFGLLMYAQAVVYLFIAPSLAAANLPASTQDKYSYFIWSALPLFCLPFLTVYRVATGWMERRWEAVPAFRVHPVTSAAAVSGMVVLALGWLWVALTRNLLYRRLGAEGIAGAQLDLSLVEFGLYRAFMEFAPFLAVFSLVMLRVARPEARLVRVCWRLGAFVTGSFYGVNVLVNSRLAGVLFLAALAGVWLLTEPKATQIRFERVVLLLLTGVFALYAVRISENVRERISNGGSPFDPANLNPVGKVGGGEEGYELRLNGIDLVALISDNVRAQGPALGTAWAVPLLLQLDPIVRTDFTEQMKRAALTTSKSFLLLQYAGIAEPDYYSCMISDAYGNLGMAGFAVVAFVLALACAFAGVGLRGGGGPAIVVLACFVLSRVLPFEQEFSSLLFGWIKLTPLLGLLLLLNPLRRERAERARPGQPSVPVIVGAT